MLERLGQEARTAVSIASEEAYRLAHPHVGTEHLLLGLLAEEATAASEALVAAGASFVSVREKVVEALASRTLESAPPAARDLPFTDRANRALERAGRLSLRMGSEHVQCEHILLSVLDVEGTAGQVLRGLWIDPEAVREELASLSSTSPPLEKRRVHANAAPAAQQDSGADGRAPGPLCRSCGSPLAASLDRVTLQIGSGKSVIQVGVFYCTVCGTALNVEREGR